MNTQTHRLSIRQTRPTLPRALLATALCLGAWAAHAQTPAEAFGERVDNRQARQEQRIDQGSASGELTRPEAARLTRQQNRIDRAEARADADGRLTRREAVALEHMQDRSSRRIAHAKHDAQARPRAR